MKAQPRKPDVAVIVPTSEEYNAVERVLNGLRQPPADLPHGGTCVIRDIQMAGRPQPVQLAITCIDEMYNFPCLRLTERVLLDLEPQLVFLVGSACGNIRRVKVCDVVVTTDHVAYLGRGRHVGETVNPRPYSEPIAQKMKNAITMYKTYRSNDFNRWNRRCKKLLNQICGGSFPGEGDLGDRPSFDIKSGLIASDDLVISWKDEDEARTLWARHILEEAKAYDMESAGFSDACARRTDQPNWTVIRGISDHGIEGMSKYHCAAAVIAAEWLRGFIAAGAGGLLSEEVSKAPIEVDNAELCQLYTSLEREEKRNRFVGKRRFMRETLGSNTEAIRALEYAISRGGVKEYEVANPEKRGGLTTGIRLDKASGLWHK